MVPAQLPVVRENIEKHGQHLFGVAGCGGEGFMYTIGNASRGLPELLLIGSFDPSVVGLALNHLGAKMREDGKPLPEGMVDIDWTFPFKVRKAGARARQEFTIQAGQYLGHEDYDVLQVMLCDKHGRYPGDEGVSKAFDVTQP